jgi:hypothetical protein
VGQHATLGDFQTRVTSELGKFLACVASLEFEIDDLLCLANSRIDVKEAGIKNYPVQAKEKCDALLKVARAIAFAWDTDAFCNEMQRVSELRQLLVHGRVTEFSMVSGGYRLKISKMTLPKKELGIQKLTRKDFEVDFRELRTCLALLQGLEERVEQLRAEVFGFGEGWPSYMALPTSNPFSAGKVLTGIIRDKA